jgi:hypothetical protein
MKTITPPLGLLEFLERVGSNAKIYEMEADADQLSLSLGCREEDILTCSLLLHADRAPRIAIHPWNQQPKLDSKERRANTMQVYLLTGYQAQWLPRLDCHTSYTQRLIQPVLTPHASTSRRESFMAGWQLRLMNSKA